MKQLKVSVKPIYWRYRSQVTQIYQWWWLLWVILVSIYKCSCVCRIGSRGANIFATGYLTTWTLKIFSRRWNQDCSSAGQRGGPHVWQRQQSSRTWVRFLARLRSKALKMRIPCPLVEVLLESCYPFSKFLSAACFLLQYLVIKTFRYHGP